MSEAVPELISMRSCSTREFTSTVVGSNSNPVSSVNPA